MGALISDNHSVENIENGLSDFHFYVPMLGRIFKAIIGLSNKDQLANPLTLDHYFADDNSFKEIGGKNYLISLCEGNLGSRIVKDYAELILELFNKRELIRIAQSIFLNSKKLDFDKSSSELIRNVQIVSILVQCLNQIALFLNEALIFIAVSVVLIFFQSKATLFIAVILILIALIFNFLTSPKLKKWGLERLEYDKKKLESLQSSFFGFKEIHVYDKKDTILEKYKNSAKGWSYLSYKLDFFVSLPKLFLEVIAIFFLFFSL